MSAITLTAAAFAAHVPVDALRHWGHRGYLAPLAGGRAPRRWRRWQIADLLRAALFGALVQHGYGLRETATIVARFTGRLPADPGALIAWAGANTLRVARVMDGLHMDLLAGPAPTPAGVAAHAVLMVDLGGLLTGILARLPLAAATADERGAPASPSGATLRPGVTAAPGRHSPSPSDPSGGRYPQPLTAGTDTP